MQGRTKICLFVLSLKIIPGDPPRAHPSLRRSSASDDRLLARCSLCFLRIQRVKQIHGHTRPIRKLGNNPNLAAQCIEDFF
jgi:hypothetical protein